MKKPDAVGRRLMLFGCILLFVISLLFAMDLVASRSTGDLTMPTIFYTGSIAGAIIVQFYGSVLSRRKSSDSNNDAN